VKGVFGPLPNRAPSHGFREWFRQKGEIDNPFRLKPDFPTSQVPDKPKIGNLI
jgi:hypothetical protein